MNFQHELSKISIMPHSHLKFWKHIYDTFPNEVVVAGSFAAVQMRHNLTGEETEYNDIDYWYDEQEDNFLTTKSLMEVIGKLNNF